MLSYPWSTVCGSAHVSPQDVGFGNKVSHSERKTRRKWSPNVQKKRLWSATLQEFLRFHVTTYALRCIDKAGGLDNYLLQTPDKKLQSEEGMAAKLRIQEAIGSCEASVDNTIRWCLPSPTCGLLGRPSTDRRPTVVTAVERLAHPHIQPTRTALGTDSPV